MIGKTIQILKMKTSSKTMSMQVNKNEDSLPMVWKVLLYAFIVVVGVAWRKRSITTHFRRLESSTFELKKA